MQITMKLEATWEDLSFEFTNVRRTFFIASFSVEWMISIKLSWLKVVANVGNPPLCSGVMAVSRGPKSHTFTVINECNISRVCSPAKMALKTLERSIVAQSETSQQTAHLCLKVVAALGQCWELEDVSFSDIDTAHRGAFPRGFQQTKRHYLKIRASVGKVMDGCLT